MNVIESEMHFLLICPRYIDIRKRFFSPYFSPYFCHWPTINKFENLLSTKNSKKLNNLAKYLFSAFKERDTT